MTTRIAVSAGEPRARVDLLVGALAPRLISRTDRSARVALAAAGMLLLGGDRVHVDVTVGSGCRLELEDVGGTVAYPTRGTPSTWTLDIRVGSGGLLLWSGLPFVVAEGSDVERRTSIDLDVRARALVRETIVLGRHGEVGGHLASAFEVADAGGPILHERLEVDGTVPEPGVLGDHRILDAVIAVGFRPDAGPRDLVLEQPGAIARHLSAHAHESGLDAIWEAWAADALHTPIGVPNSSARTVSVNGLNGFTSANQHQKDHPRRR